MLIKKKIKYLVVHCSDTSDNEDIGAKEIHQLHISFGWDGIGYHKVIRKNGLTENGRPEFWVGAHVYGFNTESLGVCLIGRDFFTKEQFISLKKTLLDWKIKFPNAKILGHCDFKNTNKTCPNFDVKKWLLKENIN